MKKQKDGITAAKGEDNNGGRNENDTDDGTGTA